MFQVEMYTRKCQVMRDIQILRSISLPYHWHSIYRVLTEGNINIVQSGRIIDIVMYCIMYFRNIENVHWK